MDCLRTPSKEDVVAEPTESEETTHNAESQGADSAHEADRPPTTDEDLAAERSREDPSMSGDQEEVGEHYREMIERGAHQKGEGEIV